MPNNVYICLAGDATHFTEIGGLFTGLVTQDLYDPTPAIQFAFGDLDFSIAVTIKSDRSAGNILTLNELVEPALRLSVADHKLEIRVGSFSATSVATVADGSWKYVSLVYSVADHVFRLYVNGELDLAAAAIVDFRSVAETAVLSAQDNRFTGWISRFHFFSGAISDSQVKELLSYSGKSSLSLCLYAIALPIPSWMTLLTCYWYDCSSCVLRSARSRWFER